MKTWIRFAGVAVLSICFSGLGIAQTGQHDHSTENTKKTISKATEEKVKDPVCGMEIPVGKAKGNVKYKGKTYYFCSDSCKEKFEKDPDKYVKK